MNTSLRNITLAAITIGTLVGCSRASEELNDAPKIDNVDTPAIRISFPDGFGNLAAKCIGTDLVYTTRSAGGRGVAVSSQHPFCDDHVLEEGEVKQ